MSQQLINIGAAPDDGTGDPNRTAFDKVNENFTEVYAKGATEGLWNYNKTDTNTSTSPVSGRFKTNSGNYLDATQIAIHATTIQGIDRANTLRTMLVGDIIQCQDSLNGAAWCRYVLSSLPVDNGTWFQLNVTMQASGAVASGDNQEIVFTFTANVSSGGGGDVSAVGTPTNGQLAQWTDATHIQGIASSSLGFAPLASPTFTGDPKAPTPTAGDNDTSIATTAFVTAAVAAAGAGGSASPPQGRLTLQTGTPVMTTTQAAKTTIYYTPYVGNQIPIYNGTLFTMTAFGELSVATTDTTKSPAAIGVSKVNDWFVWNDAGTLRVGHGPDWTSDTVRSAGTALVKVNGIWLNNADITNGPAASRGTYVGTTRSNASSQLDWIYGAVAANGTAGFFGIWNMYNRINVASFVGDSTDSWSYGTATWRAANNSATMRVSYVSGLAEDAFSAEYLAASNNSGGVPKAGIGYDVTNSPSGRYLAHAVATLSFGPSGDFVTTSLGFHFMSAIEFSTGANAIFYGSNTSGATVQGGLIFQGRM